MQGSLTQDQRQIRLALTAITLGGNRQARTSGPNPGGMHSALTDFCTIFEQLGLAQPWVTNDKAVRLPSCVIVEVHCKCVHLRIQHWMADNKAV